MWLKLAWREILNNRRFSSFFVFNLVLGLFGFLSLTMFKSSIQQSLHDRSKLILTADIGIESRQPYTEKEIQTIENVIGSNTQQTQMWSLYSMASGHAASRLVNIAAIETNYPFYGFVQLDSSQTITTSSPKDIVSDTAAWLPPDLLLNLGLRIGDTFHIGKAAFKVTHVITADAGNGRRSFDLAPRLYVGLNHLADTHLIQRGSIITYRRLIRLQPGRDADAVVKTLKDRLGNPHIRIETAQDSSESVGRLQGFLDDYLGLASLVSLFLAGLGAAYLFNSFLSHRLKEIAILMSLGVDPFHAYVIYLLQLGILGTISAILSTALSTAFMPWTIRALSWFLSYAVTPVWSLTSFAIVLLIGTLGSPLICLPFLRSLSRVKPSTLFQEQPDQSLDWSSSSFFSAIPALLVYWALAISQARSWKVGSLFILAFFLSGAGLAGIGWLGLKGVGRLASRVSLVPRLAFRNLSRAPFGSLSVFVALGLGAVLINLIPQVQKSLATEIAHPAVSHIPSLFLFDIQPEQIDALTYYVTSRGLQLESVTPLIRGQLLGINGKSADTGTKRSDHSSRSEERNERAGRGFNLTYRGALSESETIAKGRRFSPTLQDPAEISVEIEFAERLGLHLGDVMSFDIEGMPVSGRIVNFRKVQWASFQPNFFVQFQPGLLEDAPKTFLASIQHLDPTAKARLQDAIVERFPNVSMIDVSNLIDKLLSIFAQMGWALRVMAILSLLTGLIVLFSIADHQASLRRYETSLLKVMGARFEQIKGILRWEFGGLSFLSSFCGTMMSLGISYVLSFFLFDHVWVFSWQIPLLLIVTLPIVSILTVTLATRKVLRERPLSLLQNDI